MTSPPESPTTEPQSETPARKPRRRQIAIVSIAVVVTLLAALMGGELYTRHRIKDCMTSQFQQQLGSKVDIGLGNKPVLLELMDHKVPSLTVDSAEDRFGPAIGMKVHAEVHDLEMDDNGKRAGTVGSSSADVTWSADGIAETLKNQFAGTVTGVRTDHTHGTIEISGILGAQFTLRPEVDNGVVKVKTEDAKFLGFGLPTDLVDSVVKMVSDGLQQKYPLGMTVKSVTVTDSGVHLDLAGGKYDLPRPTDGQNLNTCT